MRFFLSGSNLNTTKAKGLHIDVKPEKKKKILQKGLRGQGKGEEFNMVIILI